MGLTTDVIKVIKDLQARVRVLEEAKNSDECDECYSLHKEIVSLTSEHSVKVMALEDAIKKLKRLHGTSVERDMFYFNIRNSPRPLLRNPLRAMDDDRFDPHFPPVDLEE